MMGKAKADSEFFRGNGENDALRRSFARAALKDLVDFLFQEDLGSNLEQRASDSGRVAIFDATNTTKERREWIRTSLDGLPLKLLFIESVCTDPHVIDRNIWQVKVNNEDYSTDSDKKKGTKISRSGSKTTRRCTSPSTRSTCRSSSSSTAERRLRLTTYTGE